MRWILGMTLAAGCGEGVELGDSGTAGLTASCDDGGFVDRYTAGISRTTDGGAFDVAILRADPAPPDVGLNSFTLEVTAAGAAITSGDVQIRPWMPLHGHGTSPERYPATAGEDGWEAGPADLFMPGLWELHVEIEDGVGLAEAAMFRFCLEG